MLWYNLAHDDITAVRSPPLRAGETCLYILFDTMGLQSRYLDDYELQMFQVFFLNNLIVSYVVSI